MADTPPAAPTGPPQPPHPAPQPQPHQKRRPPPPRPPGHPDDGPLRPGGGGPDGRGGPGGGPAGRERAVVAARRSNLFLLIALAGLVGAQLPLPWGIVAGTACGLAALVVGLMAVIAAMDARLPGRRVALLWVSLAVVAVVVLVQLVRLVFYPALVENQECRREAITLTAQAACEQRSGLTSR